MPRCSTIIVTYNSGESIAQCLEALATEDCEIVVVDNASQDDTVARVQAFQAHHPVELLRISRNLGFAAGVNHGVRAASEDTFLVLNPDTIAEPGAVSALIDCMTAQSAAAAGGALLGVFRGAATRLRLSPPADTRQLVMRGSADQPALAIKSREPALPLPRCRLLEAAAGRTTSRSMSGHHARGVECGWRNGHAVRSRVVRRC